MLKNLKMSLHEYLNNLTIYDYIAFSWLLFLFFTLFILSIILLKQRVKLGLFLMFILSILFFIAPIFLKIFLDKSVRKVDIVDQNRTILSFSKSLIITGKLQNSGRVDFNRCFIDAKIFKISENRYRDILNRVKPARKKSIIVDENVTIGSFMEFRIVFENFKYSKRDFNMSISAECY